MNPAIRVNLTKIGSSVRFNVILNCAGLESMWMPI